MKKIMSVTLAMLFAVLCVIPAFAAGYSCSLSADKNNANVGDTVTISVNVGSGLTGLETIISFDTAYFELVDAKTTSLMVTIAGTSKPGQVHLAGAATEPTKAGEFAKITLKVLKTGGQISCNIKDALDAADNDVSSQMNDSSIKIYAGSAPTTQNNQQNNNQNNNQQNNSQNSSQQSAQSNQGAAAANGNAQTNANTTANSTPAVTTQVAAQAENTVPEVAANATEAVSENTDTLTVGATEKKSIIPLIVAIVAALASAAAIVYIILKKKKEEKETGI